MDVDSLADLLHETSGRHGRSGRGPDEASDAADRYMAEVKHVVVSST
jgi:hypothetical protein